MERLSQENRITFSGCLFMGLVALAIGLTCLSVWSRPDSENEFIEDCVIDVVMVAPLWAVATFFKLRSRHSGIRRTLILAAAAYLAFGCLLVAIQVMKYRSRSRTGHVKTTASARETRTQRLSSKHTPGNANKETQSRLWF